MVKRKSDCTPDEWARHLARTREYNARYYAKPEAVEKRRATARAKYNHHRSDPVLLVKQQEQQRAYNSSPKARERDRLRRLDPARRQGEYERHIKRLYGLTAEDLESLLTKQDNRCAVCSRAFSSEVGRHHVDHCHASGRVRGLLCARCNSTEGFLNSLGMSPLQFAERLQAYLNDPPAQEEQLW